MVPHRLLPVVVALAASCCVLPAVASAAPVAAEPTPPSGAPPAQPNPGPSISGTGQVGGTLTGDRGRWEPDAQLSSEWIRCATADSGCETTGDTDLSYALTDADAGKVIKLRVTGRRVVVAMTVGTRVVDTATGAIAAASPPATAPANVASPQILGIPRTGSTLTGSPGVWTGTAPITFAYAWSSCASPAPASCVPVSSTRSYRPVAADAGRYLALAVQATNPAGKRQALVVSAAVGRTFRGLSPFPVLLVGGRVAGRVTTVTSVRLRRVPRGARVSTSCSGRGCPYRKSSTVVRKGSTIRLRRLERRLRSGVTVVITVRKGKTLGKYVRLRFRRGLAPARIDRCVAPGSSKPRPCR